MNYRGENELTPSARSALIRRLYSRLIIDPSGCLLWQGNLDRYGYGKIWVSGRQVQVFRVTYALFVASIPDGFEVDHLCRVRNCASPAHLEAVTGKENNLRGNSFAAINARKTKCDNGHAYAPENTYLNPSGSRDCRMCIRDRVARYRARKNAS